MTHALPASDELHLHFLEAPPRRRLPTCAVASGNGAWNLEATATLRKLEEFRRRFWDAVDSDLNLPTALGVSPGKWLASGSAQPGQAGACCWSSTRCLVSTSTRPRPPTSVGEEIVSLQSGNVSPFASSARLGIPADSMRAQHLLRKATLSRILSDGSRVSSQDALWSGALRKVGRRFSSSREVTSRLDEPSPSTTSPSF